MSPTPDSSHPPTRSHTFSLSPPDLVSVLFFIIMLYGNTAVLELGLLPRVTQHYDNVGPFQSPLKQQGHRCSVFSTFSNTLYEWQYAPAKMEVTISWPWWSIMKCHQLITIADHVLSWSVIIKNHEITFFPKMAASLAHRQPTKLIKIGIFFSKILSALSLALSKAGSLKIDNSVWCIYGPYSWDR